jgi:DNA-binding transcriptional LysR family regulator
MGVQDGSMNLRQMEIVVAVSELGTLSKTSERLRVGQPALSRQVRLIEEELGASLFRRSPKGMVATPVGEVMVNGARAILRQLDMLRKEARSYAAEPFGRLSIALPDFLEDHITGDLLSALDARFPKLALTFSFSAMLTAAASLRAGELNIAVMHACKEVDDLVQATFFEDGLWLVGNKDADLASDRPVEAAALQGRPFILPGPADIGRRLYEDVMVPEGIRPKIRLEVRSANLLKHLVAQGVGYSVLPLAAVEAQIRSGALKGAPLAGEQFRFNVVLAASPESSPAFVHTLAGALGPLLHAPSHSLPDGAARPSSVRPPPAS